MDARVDDKGVVVGKYLMTEAQSSCGAEKIEVDIQQEVNKHLNDVTFKADNTCEDKIIRPQQNDVHHLCPFTGGGDILLQHNQQVGILNVGLTPPELEDEDNQTPFIPMKHDVGQL